MPSLPASAESLLPPTLDESTRLEVLRGLCLLDSPPDPVFDTVAAMAARSLDAEIAVVSLVDEHRQWFKARIGWKRAKRRVARRSARMRSARTR